ncbi:MAG TPA: Ig-like domain repeat protein, partial [Microbacterium sp.]
ITGTPAVGKKLTASPGTWDMDGLTFSYQWLRDGQPIEGATATTYKVVGADRGTSLSVRVTAAAEGRPSGVADSAPVFVKFGSSTKVTVSPYIGSSAASFAVTVAVTPTGGAAATGEVALWVNGAKYSGTLADGKVTIPLPKQSRGVKVVVAQYAGSDTVEGSTGLSGFIVLR